jgi:geranylgeranyl reductase family protein
LKDKEAEVLIIGAGPAGLVAAREAAKRHVEVIVLEEHKEIGSPCHCAGLLSLKGLRKIGMPEDETFIQNRVKGARFFSPSNLSFTVERDKPVACVVERSAFDKFLAKQAKEAGAQVYLGSRVRFIKRDRKGMIAQLEKRYLGAEIIIDAEGSSSKVLRFLGMKSLNPAFLLPGLQFDLKGVDIDPNYVEVHVGRKVAPSFFAWVIPLSRDSVRVGLACKGANPKEKLEDFIASRFQNHQNLERIAVRSGQVVTCGPIEKTFSDNLLVVGDAAGQVKPLTGGGVVLGGICAVVAGEIAAEAIKGRDFRHEFLRRYEVSWKRIIGKEFTITKLARNLVNRLSDKSIDKIFRIILEKNLQDLIAAEGNMDSQSKIILKLIKKKEVLEVFPSFIRTLFHF